MANKDLKIVRAPERESVPCPFTIKIVGAADPANNVITIEHGRGIVSSVSRTGTGEIKVILKDKWTHLLACEVGLQSSADREARLLAQDVSGSTPYMTFNTISDALAPEDTPNSGTDRIHVVAWMKNSSVF